MCCLQLATATGGGSPTRNTAASKFDVDFEFCGSSDVNGNERFDDSANTDFDMPDTNGHNVASMLTVSNYSHASLLCILL